MAATTEEFIIRLNQQVSGPAEEAAAAVAELTSNVESAQEAASAGLKFESAEDAFAAIQSGSDALREMEAQLEILQGAAEADQGAIDALTASIEAQRDAVSQAQQAFVDFGGSAQEAVAATDGTGEAAEGSATNLRALAGSTRMLGGEFGGTASKGIRLVQMFSRLGPEAIAAVAAFAILAAGIAAFVGFVAAGISASGQMRDELLSLQGAMKGNAGAAAELQGAISKVSSTSALSRDKIAGYATSLAQAGLKGAELNRALEAMAIAGSAGGDEAAQAFLKAAKAAKATGGSVDDLSKKMKAQLGGVAAEQALSLSVQFAKMKEDITALFNGATLEPFLKGLHEITGMFSQNTAIGRELRAVITSAMNGFLAAASKVLPYVKAFLIGLVAGAVQAYIWFVKVKNAIMSVVGPILEALGASNGLSAAMAAGKYIVEGIAVVFLALAAVVVIVVGTIVGAIALVVAVVGAVVSAVSKLWDMFFEGVAIVSGVLSGIANTISSFSLADAASGLIDGFVQGITGSIGKVVAAVANLGHAAIAALKGAIDSHSPSRKFAAIGDEGIGGGLVQGVERAAPDVEDAVGGIVDPKSAKSAAKGAKGGSSAAGAGSKIVYIEKLILGGDAGPSQFEAFRSFLRGEFEVETLSVEPAGGG